MVYAAVTMLFFKSPCNKRETANQTMASMNQDLMSMGVLDGESKARIVEYCNWSKIMHPGFCMFLAAEGFIHLAHTVNCTSCFVSNEGLALKIEVLHS